MMNIEVKSKVIELISARGPIPGMTEDEKLGYMYLDEGLVDSIGVVELVMEIESALGVRLEPEHMQSEEFRTIGGLIRIIERVRGA